VGTTVDGRGACGASSDVPEGNGETSTGLTSW
jgi:hypothetical protein